MAQPVLKTAKQWNVVGYDGLESLKYSEQPVPELGDTEVLVRIHGASLNFRDIMVSQGKFPWGTKPNVIPGSDGAGIVVATGRHVSRFRPGDKVITVLNPRLIAGSFTEELSKVGLGASVDGTLRTAGVFDEQGLVSMPEGLTFPEAATLSCAGLTAWNALFGLSGKPVAAGQWVLTQGTGGVSIFAVQFAKLVGARVIATTSSSEKAKLLEKLGADQTINYRETPDWASAARELTGGFGVDYVIDVVGPTSLKQSVAAVKHDGVVCVLGGVGGGDGSAEMPVLLDCWMKLFTARGLWLGTRLQMEDMCRAIEANIDKLRPIVDPKIFTLEQTKEAYEYLASGKHQGKVCIEIA
ncbi:putative alcohol dehydrogenase [Daldinia decipiens]|uniref:putative alcohol dehydrogenase n=1 Tax=Daldinia decipiens TaxID=326647 RepID=UPI0020C2646D|nr:putative alcohol dehydrogenase [Daldinia decipiens]KAI1657804.1 putative alcohol dehydrogenase [Daldinia decipiens]